MIRLCIVLLLLSLALPIFADGMAYGKGFTPQLRETHQLAVIRLTESSADVSMFIAIEGIPAGKELTYILPFWYAPDGFSLRDIDAEAFRKTVVTPANRQVERMKRLAEHQALDTLLTRAPFLSTGLPGLLLSDTLGMRAKGQSAAAGAPLVPYAVSETPQARAALYRLGDGELQQLLAQSGLPARYLVPLQKYHTPYFAVMTLRGLPVSKQTSDRFGGRGVQYHFTHRLTKDEYIYPLGTGAAWPQPIPITEVYLTCPDRLALQVDAPTEGEALRWIYFTNRVRSVANYLALSPREQAKIRRDASTDDMQEFLGPKTSHIFETEGRSSAWHAAYLQSNPDTDILVRITPRAQAWRLAVADFLGRDGVMMAFLLALYAVAWGITYRLVIRRRWLRTGKPCPLAREAWGIFFKAQLLTPALVWAAAMLAGFMFWIVDSLSHNRSVTDLPWIGVTLVLVATAGLVTALIHYIRQQSDDWRKGLTLYAGLCSMLCFGVLAALLGAFVYWCETL